MRTPKAIPGTFLFVGLLAAAAPGLADQHGHKLIWKRIVGIAAPNSLVGRPIGGGDCNVGVDCVVGTPGPWITTEGRAEVDLDRGTVAFSVKGLVVATDPSFANIGTTSLITFVKATLVCNDTQPGVPELVDADAVPLSSRGNASFRGHVDLPASCLAEPDDIDFLIRIADVGDPDRAFLIDMYNAFGALRVGPGEAELAEAD